jgi:hypothetical protein
VRALDTKLAGQPVGQISRLSRSTRARKFQAFLPFCEAARQETALFSLVDRVEQRPPCLSWRLDAAAVTAVFVTHGYVLVISAPCLFLKCG